MNTQIKQWASEKVAREHGYLNASDATVSIPAHKEIAQAIYYLTYMLQSYPMKIADLGCGNGRIIQALRGTGLFFDYTGFDFNEACLKVARSTYPEFQFRSLDLDLSSGSVGHYDGVVFDSTLSMVEDPRSLLISLLERNRGIVVGRVKWGTDTKRGEHLWSGMTAPSVNWEFSPSFFEEVAKTTGGVECSYSHSRSTVLLRKE